jgi:hypothetical protein
MLEPIHNSPTVIRIRQGRQYRANGPINGDLLGDYLLSLSVGCKADAALWFKTNMFQN